MALNTDYVVGITIGEYFVDKTTGLPLAGGKMYFKKDTNHSVGKYAYQLTGSPPNYTYTPLPNPLTLSSVGTPIIEDTNIAIYFYPYDELGNLDLYFVEVTDADGNIQLQRQAWPNVDNNLDPLNEISGLTDNQILNPQFSDVYFEQDYGVLLEWTGVISNQVFPVGPGWDLIVSATDTASIQLNRIELAGSSNINTNPPYALSILPEGASIASIKLRQSFFFNPNIWANNILSGFMLIASLDSEDHTIEMTYTTSIPDIPKTVLTATTGEDGYVSAAGTVDIGAGLNTDAPPEGTTYIDILLPRTGYVAISSIQVVPVPADSGTASYIQNSVNKQQSDLFCYQYPLIKAIPVPSILQGWDFRVNPSQWGSTVSMGMVASEYLWDQLIGWQSVNSLVTASQRNPRGLNIALSTTGQFALIQYLGGPQLRQLLSGTSSVLMKAFTDLGAGAIGTVSIWITTDASLPDVYPTTNESLITTLDASGKPATFHGTWTEIPRYYRGDAKFTIPYDAGGVMHTIPLEGWNAASVASDMTATFGAIVVGFSETEAANIAFESISLTPGVIAVPVAPLSYDLTLQELSFYYEKSYNIDIIPGTITDNGMLVFPATPASTEVEGQFEVFINSFNLIYDLKRVPPLMIFYSPVTGAENRVSLISHIDGVIPPHTGGDPNPDDVNISNWTRETSSDNKDFYLATTVNIGYSTDTSVELTRTESLIRFQFTADARYGVI